MKETEGEGGRKNREMGGGGGVSQGEGKVGLQDFGLALSSL